MPTRRAEPLFLKLTDPEGPALPAAATSTRVDTGSAVTVPVGGAAESSLTAICRPLGTPVPDGIDAPSYEPADCAVPLMVIVCDAPGCSVNDVGDCVKKLPF